MLFLLLSSFFLLKQGFASKAVTVFDIGNVTLTYTIFENQSYQCTFFAQVHGNTETIEGNVPGTLIATGEVNNVLLTFEGDVISPQITSISGNTQISFNIQSSLQPGSEYELSGSYTGLTSKNEVASLGIDWGTRTSLLQTYIYLERGLVLLEVDPTAQRISVVAGGKLQLSWTDVNKQIFLATIDFSSESTTRLMTANINTWTITSSKPLIVTIQSFVNYELHCFVVTPSWISANTTQFVIDPNSTKAVSFTLSDTLPPRGTTGIIQISAREILTKIEIPVEIPTGSGSDPFIISLIAAFIGSAIFIVAVFLFQNRQLIVEKVSEFRTSLNKPVSQQTSSTDLSHSGVTESQQDFPVKESVRLKAPWNEVEEKWQNFLNPNELNVLKLLHEGPKNQQTIADELGLSKSTMSRLLARLEQKRLILRKKEGMSNIVTLNWETI
ncbi:MAG: helix-turn-helix transcriptional regulator [Candidatus Hodarchaeota archaeon]